MNQFFTFDEIDKKLWLGIGAVFGIMLILLTIFTSTPIYVYVEKMLSAVLVIFLPGYFIYKLFLGGFTLSDNKVADLAIVSFGLSIVVMVVPYFLSTYLRPYVFNTDEEGQAFISNNQFTILLLIVVIAIAFGYKYYLIKKGTSPASSEGAEK
jgi:uncharacterized membrane protein